jgi:hypothetical protein
MITIQEDDEMMSVRPSGKRLNNAAFHPPDPLPVTGKVDRVNANEHYLGVGYAAIGYQLKASRELILYRLTESLRKISSRPSLTSRLACAKALSYGPNHRMSA